MPRPTTPARAVSSAVPAAIEAPDAPGIAITITPSPTPAPHVDVFVVARHDDIPLTAWSMSKVAYDELAAPLIASDIDGPIAMATRDEGAIVRITLARQPKGRVTLGYAIAAKPPQFPKSPDVAYVDPDRFEAYGDTLLALPDVLDDKLARVDLRVASDHLGVAGFIDAASSFGSASAREVNVRSRDLRQAFYVAGLMGKAVFDGPEGHDEAVWVGYTAFDPRPAAADIAGLRTEIRLLFRSEPLPATLLFATDTRPTGAFVASRRASGVLVRVGVGETWSGAVRIAVATEVLKEWIGERLYIGEVAPPRDVESTWFTEGVTRCLARDLLFRFGLVTPGEVASEVEGLAALVATSKLRGETNASLAKRAKEPGVLPLLVARGALYALRTDAIVREKSQGKRSLADVLRDLYVQAAKTRGPLPVSAWTDALEHEAGASEGAAFRDAIDNGKPFDLPERALGPCFRRVTRKYAAFDLGFDLEQSREKKTIIGLERDGPAAKAGLHDGDVLVEARVTAGRSDVPVEVIVDAAGSTRSIRYKPAGATGSGPGWERKKEVSDDACTK